jgi:hypothetical protein
MNSLFVSSIKDILCICVEQTPILNNSSKKIAKEGILKESDENILRFLLTGNTDKKTIHKKKIEESLDDLNEELRDVIVNEIGKVVPLKEDTMEDIYNLSQNYYKVHGKTEEAKKFFTHLMSIEKAGNMQRPEAKEKLDSLYKMANNLKEPQLKKVGKYISNKLDRHAHDVDIGNYIRAATHFLNKAVKKKDYVGMVKNIGKLSYADSIDRLKKMGDETGATGIASKLGFRGGKDAVAGGIGAIVLASILAYGSYKLYQRYKANAANRCAKLTGEAKNKCFEKLIMAAKVVRQNDLKRSIGACDKSSDPNKCKKLVMQKIKDIRESTTIKKEVLLSEDKDLAANFIATSFIFIYIIGMSYNLYKAFRDDKIRRMCKNKKNAELEDCKKIVEKLSLQNRINYLKKNKEKCRKDKDSEKCYREILNKIVELEAKLKKIGH